eukprot:431358_1
MTIQKLHRKLKMRMLILLFCFLIANVSTTVTNRQIIWWANVGEDATTDANNVNTIKQHINLFSGLQLNWPPGSQALSLNNWYNQTSAVSKWLSLYAPLNIPLFPTVLSTSNATIMKKYIYTNVTYYASQLINIAKIYGFSGYNIDYEPQPDYSDRDPESYTNFLQSLTTILKTENLKLFIWVADWSEAINDYGLLVKSGVNALQDMTTYHKPTLEEELLQINYYMNQIYNSVKSYDQCGIGLGPYAENEWNEKKLNIVLSNITNNGGYIVDIFRILMDGTNNWPPNYWYTSLDKFMNGTI